MDYDKASRFAQSKRNLIIVASVLLVLVIGLLAFLYISRTSTNSPVNEDLSKQITFSTSSSDTVNEYTINYPSSWLTERSEDELLNTKDITIANSKQKSEIIFSIPIVEPNTSNRLPKSQIVEIVESFVLKETNDLSNKEIREYEITRLPYANSEIQWFKQEVLYSKNNEEFSKLYVIPLDYDSDPISVEADFPVNNKNNVEKIINAINK